MRALVIILAALVVALPAVAQTDALRWTFRETEEGVHLRYGGPESDNVLATFVCYKGSNSVELYLVFQSEPTDAEGRTEPLTAQLSLSSGDRAATFEVPFHDDHEGEGITLTYQRPTADPMLQAMAANGRFKAVAFGETLAPPPFSKARLREFLHACRKGVRP